MTADYLWLDDFRTPPTSDGWAWVKDYDQAIAWFEANDVPKLASLDHDLADIHYAIYRAQVEGDEEKVAKYMAEHDEKTGLDVVEWMIEHDYLPPRVIVHSMNNICGARMVAKLILAGDYAIAGQVHFPNASPHAPILDRRI